MATSVGSRRRNSLLASIKTHLCRRGLSHLTSSAGHAGAGGVRNRAISDRIFANICRDTAISANRKGLATVADDVGADLDQLLA
jgi:hypothetical protein